MVRSGFAAKLWQNQRENANNDARPDRRVPLARGIRPQGHVAELQSLRAERGGPHDMRTKRKRGARAGSGEGHDKQNSRSLPRVPNRPCPLGLCDQGDCLCGTVPRTRKCPTHGEWLRVEAVPLYTRWIGGKRHNKPTIAGWAYYLNCPVPGCGYARAWKAGPANKKRGEK